jgi:single-strand DNA-binding protein
MTKTGRIIEICDKNSPDNYFIVILHQCNKNAMIKPSNGEGDESMINQVTLVGRLTRDPELKKTTDGTAVTHITLAVNRPFRNHNGEFETDFVQCTIWRKAAENTCQYCRKGAVVGVTGRLQSRNYDNKEGKRVYVTEVVTETIRFLSARPHDSEPEQKKEETAVGIS